MIEYDYPTFHLSMDCFWAEIICGQIVLKEAEDAKWLTIDKLDSVRWLPADVAVISCIKNNIRVREMLTRKVCVEKLNEEKTKKLWGEIIVDAGDQKIEWCYTDVLYSFKSMYLLGIVAKCPELKLHEVCGHTIRPQNRNSPRELAYDKFYNDVIEQLNKNARFENLRNKIRDQALVACFSERYDEFMWKNYTLDSEGICLVYNLNDIFLSLPSELKFYPVRYVDNRKKQKDIWFTSKEYNFIDNSEPEYLKFLFSCLTKERIPYSSEVEWRLFSDFSELEEGENGKKFDFLVKPRAIVKGRNIERNLDFRDRVREYSSKSGIRLLKAQDIKK